MLSCQSGLCVFRLPLGPPALWSVAVVFLWRTRPRAVSPGTREAGAILVSPQGSAGQTGRLATPVEAGRGRQAVGAREGRPPRALWGQQDPPASKVTPHAGLDSGKLVTLRLRVGTWPAFHPPRHPVLICCPVIWDVCVMGRIQDKHTSGGGKGHSCFPRGGGCAGPGGGSAQQPGKQDELPGTHAVPDAPEIPQTARVPAEDPILLPGGIWPNRGPSCERRRKVVGVEGCGSQSWPRSLSSLQNLASEPECEERALNHRRVGIHIRTPGSGTAPGSPTGRLPKRSKYLTNPQVSRTLGPAPPGKSTRWSRGPGTSP